MLGRAARDLELPEAYLFTLGVPGEDEPSIRNYLEEKPVAHFLDGARCLEKLLNLAMANDLDKSKGAKIVKQTWRHNWYEFKWSKK